MEARRPLFKRAWDVLSDRPVVYVLVTALPFVVCNGSAILAGRFILHLSPAPRESWDPLSLWQSMGWGERLLVMMAITAAAAVPSYVAARGVCRMALDAQKEIETPFGGLLLDMLRFVPAAILYFFVMGIPAFIGGFFLVVPGLLITALFALVIPAGADGGLGPLAALHRGLSLSRRVFGRVLGVYAILFLAAIVVRLVVGVGAAIAGESPYTALLVAMVGLPMGLLALAIVNIAIALLYCDARDAGGASVPRSQEDSNAQQANAG